MYAYLKKVIIVGVLMTLYMNVPLQWKQQSGKRYRVQNCTLQPITCLLNVMYAPLIRIFHFTTTGTVWCYNYPSPVP